MNNVIETLTNHRSIRSFTEQTIDNELLDQIADATQAAPSWINGQQMSVVVVKDSTTKQRLAELVGNQSAVAEAPVFFVFCADFYRASLASTMEKTSFAVSDDIDALLVGATDVGLAMGNAIAAAESLGLSIVPIGGIRKNPLEVIELLDLPKYVLPISGLCIGYANQNPELKPRFAKEAVFHEETYKQDLIDQIVSYNRTMIDYSNGQGPSWTERVASFYSMPFTSYTAAMLERQGFSFKNTL
ncbi:NADPH-dependent oxidoreductase [Bacillus alkalicellulosilyticus]|uniref:NADPH-dependent oxidoreductase n=1 Tax=Alkalihalobacterium alkalicellulosilyticum TaxID=1912214 RepID=UPI000997B10B|nr:NADPH-dependent oxidoreductase [Bacillus alkalicellulosilyticus]